MRVSRIQLRLPELWPERWPVSPPTARVMVVALTLLALPFGLSASSFAGDPSAGEPAAENPAAENPGAGEPHPLSVAPLSQVTYPADRPEWVDAPPTLAGSIDSGVGHSGAVDVWTVKSLLRPSAAEARESLQVQMQGATAAYAEQFLGSERAQRLSKSVPLAPELEMVPAEDHYAGTAVLGDQTVYEEAVRLRFDEAYRQRLAAEWRQAEVGSRLKWLGVAGTGGFVLLLSATGLVRRTARRRSGGGRHGEGRHRGSPVSGRHDSAGRVEPVA